MSLDSHLNYVPKANSAQTRSYRSNISSFQTTNNQNSTLTFYVPTGQPNVFLNQSQSYLKFRINNNSTLANGNPVVSSDLDGGAWAVLQSMSIYHGAVLLESIENYNVIYSLLYDLTGAENRGIYGSICYGCDDTELTSAEDDRKGAALVYTAGTSGTYTTTYGNNPAASIFCLPIMSSVIGTLCDKYLPLCDMGASDLRIEFTLSGNPFVMTNSTDNVIYTITEAELILDLIELNSTTKAMLDQQTGRNYNIHGSTYICNVGNLISAVQGTQTINISAKYQSIKSLLCAPINNTTSSGKNFPSISGRSRGNIASVQFKIGGLNYPQKAIQCQSNGIATGAEVFCELMKALHALHSPNLSGILGNTHFNRNALPSATTDADRWRSGFAFGIELESFSHSNDVIMCGTNTMGTNVTLDVYCQTALSDAVMVYIFAYVDTLISISNGQATSIK